MSAYPQPGDTGIAGHVLWVNGVTGSGEVSANALDYPPTATYVPDPLRFAFQRMYTFTLSPGQAITFDVVQGTDAAYADNVQPA